MWGRGLKMNVFCIFFDFQLKIHSLKIYSWVSGVSPAGRGGVLPYKSDQGARRKISRTSHKGTRIFLFFLLACPKLICTFKRYQFNNKLYNWHCKIILMVIKITFEQFLLKEFLKVLS